MVEKTLKELGFAENTIKTYIRLLELGSATARQLAENIGMPRPSIYDHLRILLEQGLIVEQNENNKKMFKISDINNLKQLIKDKIESLKSESQGIEKYIPIAKKESVEPQVRHFRGAEQVAKILNDLFWYENTEILSIWPMEEMLAVFGSEYLDRFNRKRIKNNNNLRIVWPNDKVVDIKKFPFLGVGKEHMRDLRIAPINMTWNMGHLIYGDKVAFVSSRKERFGFIVQSRDFADLMRAQFKVFWNISKPVDYKPPKNDLFIASIKNA